MGSDFDEAGFKKARGFLMAFSTLIIVLYYFSVDLNSISILGNSVHFTENRERAWLALLVVDVYLFFRYVQQFPDSEWYPDKEMHGAFQSILVAISKKIYYRRLFEAVVENRQGDGVEVVSISPQGHLNHQEDFSDSPVKVDRCDITFSISYRMYTGVPQLGGGTGVQLEITPNRLLVILSRMLAFARVVIFKPWFLEHMFPVVYAGIAGCLAFMKWWQINHVVSLTFKNSFNQLLMSL